jgi:threonine/homoserine/homoserine lactone efflux protein
MSFYEVVGTLVVTVILVAVPGICVFAHIYEWPTAMYWAIATLCEVAYLWWTLVDHARKQKKAKNEKENKG